MGRDSSFSKAESDYELIKAIGAGDIVAFEMLIDRYRGPVLNFIFKYTGDRFGAEDIAQEVFLRIIGGPQSSNQGEKYRHGFSKIAYNLSVNELSARKPVCADDLHRRLWGLLESNDARLKELAQEMMEAIVHLPEKQRAALLLRVNEDLSYAEIGNVLSTSIASVESLLFRARENLRKVLIGGTKD